MKAFAILSGGGVKGAALAGCLAAGEGQEIEFIGYGGTSAGSIVALLASVGYSGEGIRDLILNDVSPKTLLDDEGSDLSLARDCLQRCAEIFKSSSRTPTKLWRYWRVFKDANWLIQRLWSRGGLYTGAGFRSILLDIVTRAPSKVKHLKGRADITFSDLEDAGCTPLRIVASDISGQRAAVYSANDTSYGTSVIEAVRASISYPFVFEPAVGQGNRKLADGGLSSNLPAFLFAYEADISRVPIFAFDLGSSARLNTGESGLHDFVAGLFSTALEAGDELLIGLIPRVHRVSVPVPEGINTLDFDIEDADIQALYNAGLAATTEFLNDLPVMAYTKQAGDKLQQQLQANYGDPKLFQPALWGLAAMIEERTGAREVRSSVMLPTGRPNRSRIVTYHHAYRVGDTDSDFELDEFAGCSGHSLETRSPAVADLDEAKKDPRKWGMTAAQQAKVAADRKSMLSVPIFAYSSDHQLDPDDWPILGILSVDSSTPLSETGWVGGGIIEPVVGIPDRGAQAMTAMTAWADIISALIR